MLGIVVVSFGSADLLHQNLARLETTAMRTPSTVVVVDNFRSSRSQAAVRSLAKERGWALLTNDDNRGFGAAVNQGVARATSLGCTSLLVLNPDARAAPEVIDALADEVSRRPRCLVAPRVVRPDGSIWFDGGVVDLSAGWTVNLAAQDLPRDGRWLSGACLATSAEMWRELDGFDEDYFLYWEDVDLSYRCAQAGGELLVRSDLEVAHDVGGTQGNVKSAAYHYYNCRNRLLFAAKNLPAEVTRAWVRRTPAYARRVLLRSGRRRVLRSPSLVWATLRGSLGGLVLAARVARTARAAR